MALDMALKFYASVEKRLKLKVRKCAGIIRTFVEVAGVKLEVGPDFLPPPPPNILNKVNNQETR